jgi:hypothetical protein
LALVFWVEPCPAWQEILIQGDHVSVQLERDGVATIRHELIVKIRGGPVPSIELAGLRADIEVLPEARVRLARATHASWPLEISVRPDGNATLKIVAERGLRGGTYLFGFSYRDRFEVGDEVERGTEATRVHFVGPRFQNGLDSAKLTWIVPSGSTEPKLPDVESHSGATPLLAQVRRGERDEVDLVRTHIARGEPAVWSLELSPDALDGGSGRAGAPESPRLEAPRPRPTWTLTHGAALAFSMALALLTYLKAKALERATERLRLRSWALWSLPPIVRSLVTLALCLGAAWLAISYRPWFATLVALGLLANMVFLFPSRKVEVRGPGQWQLVPASTWSRGVPRTPLGLAYLDVGRASGFCLFALLASSLLFFAYRELNSSSYRALLLASAALLLIPLFFTGRSVDFPEAPLTQARRWLAYLERRIGGAKVQKFELWGRYGLGVTDLEQAEVDEARLRVRLPKRVVGLRALEIAFEEGAGRFVVPCLLVRVEEGSAAFNSIADEGQWVRGPVSEERVLLLRPTIPTPAQLGALLERILAKISSARPVSSEPSESAKSAGKGATAEKRGAALHAT